MDVATGSMVTDKQRKEGMRWLSSNSSPSTGSRMRTDFLYHVWRRQGGKQRSVECAGALARCVFIDENGSSPGETSDDDQKSRLEPTCFRILACETVVLASPSMGDGEARSPNPLCVGSVGVARWARARCWDGIGGRRFGSRG